jgi:DNA-binding MarR family transcriptional regulator
MGIDRSTMVLLIDQLESGGLAKRRPSATDRRALESAPAQPLWSSEEGD